MKKIIAFLILLSFIMLCGCSDNGKTPSSSPTDPVETTLHPNAFSEWNSTLIPEEFPDPVKGMHDLKIEAHKASEDTYRTEWVSLTFTCFERDIYSFSNALDECGYSGGIKNIFAPTSYYFEGFNGSWQNGKHIIRVSNAKLLDSGEIEFTFDILECRESFLEGIETEFPRFDGYAISTGKYYLYNDDKSEVISQKFSGIISDNSWYLDYGYEDAFIGVTTEELTAYENVLVEAGFYGNCSTSVVDGCTVISYDLFKTVGDKQYAVFAAYNQTIKLLDIVYTNDASLFTGTE